MGNYFVRIQTTSPESLRQLQQLADLDIFPHTARRLAAEAFEVEGLLSEAQVGHLRAAGYEVDVMADAEQVARERRSEIVGWYETQGAKLNTLKGYELYSWETDGEWHYALVVGTNRLKAFDEIASPSVAVKSLDELRTRLAQLARGEEIVWVTWTDARLALPPQPIVDEIIKASQDLGLNLTVASK